MQMIIILLSLITTVMTQASFNNTIFPREYVSTTIFQLIGEDNQGLIGLSGKRSFLIKPDYDFENITTTPAIAESFGFDSNSCTSMIRLRNDELAILCSKTTISIFSDKPMIKASFTDTMITSFKEYKMNKLIIYKEINNESFIELLAYEQSSSLKSLFKYSFGAKSSYYECNYIPYDKQFFICVYFIDTQNIFHSVQLDGSLKIIKASMPFNPQLPSIGKVWSLCSDNDRVIIIFSDTTDPTRIQGVIVHKDGNGSRKILNDKGKNYDTVALVKLSVNRLIAVYEIKFGIFIDQLDYDLVQITTAVEYIEYYVQPQNNFISSLLINRVTSVFSMIAPVWSDNKQKNMGVFLFFPKCTDKVFFLGPNKSIDIILGEKYQRVILHSKTPPSITVSFPDSYKVKINNLSSGKYVVGYNVIENIQTLVTDSNTPDHVDVISEDCLMSLYVCKTYSPCSNCDGKYPSFEYISCITAEELLIEIDNNLNTKIDKLAKEYQQKTIGNSTIQIFNTSEIGIEEAWMKGKNISQILFDDFLPIINPSGTNDFLIYKKDTINLSRLAHQVDHAVFHLNNYSRMSLDGISRKLSIPLLNLNSSDMIKAKFISSYGINPFNATDPFFIDICFNSFTLNGFDLSRKDRIINYLLNNSAICPPDCYHLNLFNETNTTLCNCNNHLAPKGSYESVKAALLASIPNFNYEVFLCYKPLFSSEYGHNYGSWAALALFFLCLVCIGFFCYRRLSPIRSYINKIAKEKEQGIKDFPVAIVPGQTSIRVQMMALENEAMQHELTNDKSHKLNDIKIYKKMDKSMNHDHDHSHKNDHDENNKEQENPKERIARNRLYFPEEYNRMTAYQCFKNDDRGFDLHYIIFLMKLAPLLNTFFYRHKIPRLEILKYLQFLVSMMIHYAFVAFFYNDCYISYYYNNAGVTDYLLNLPISVYAYLVGLFFNVCSDYLLNVEQEIRSMDMMTSYDEMLVKIKSFYCCYTGRVACFLVLQVIMMLLSLYYISVFCAVYSNMQYELMISGLISTAFKHGVPFLSAMICTCVMKATLKCKSVCFFYLLRKVIK